MQVLADSREVAAAIDRLADAIASDMRAAEDAAAWALVGIRSRGDVLAQRIAQRIGEDRFGGRVGSLDITLYRDDLSEIGAQAVVRTTHIPFSIDGLHVVLVDDVLMTGRSIRAALQSLMDFGRARRIWLTVLVDRGGRELPIASDHVAIDLAGQRDGGIAAAQHVQVHLTPTDPDDAVLISPRLSAGEPAT